MKYVIEIPDEEYRRWKVEGEIDALIVRDALVNGIPLPKGHGRLIDVSQLLTVTECKEDGTERCYVPYVHIKEAETIIEAESEVKE